MRPVLTHIALHVRDIEASLAFYRAYCGLEAIHDRGGDGAKRVVWLAGPETAAGAVIVLLAGGPGREQDFDGNAVKFSYGQPLGPGADEAERLARYSR